MSNKNRYKTKLHFGLERWIDQPCMNAGRFKSIISNETTLIHTNFINLNINCQNIIHN